MCFPFEAEQFHVLATQEAAPVELLLLVAPKD